MEENKIRLIVIDKKMDTCEIEINYNQFKQLGIETKNVKIHSKKRSMNNTINEFLESFKNKKI